MSEKQKTDIDVRRDMPAPAPVTQRDLFGTLRSEIDRLFDDLTWPVLAMPRLRRSALTEPLRTWMPAMAAIPAMDFVEKEGGYEVTLDMPGMTSDDIDLRLTDGTLQVRGVKATEKQSEEAGYRVSERFHGTIERAVVLPDGIDRDNVAAHFENGVLKVTLPKTASAKAAERRIEVKAA